jgi:hypothetical protein
VESTGESVFGVKAGGRLGARTWGEEMGVESSVIEEFMELDRVCQFEASSPKRRM